MRHHPNAIVAFAAAGPGAQAILQVSAVFGVSISPGQAIYVSAALAAVALAIGRAGAFVFRTGVRNCWRRILDGEQDLQPSTQEQEE
jgi:hypothetical protein